MVPDERDEIKVPEYGEHELRIESVDGTSFLNYTLNISGGKSHKYCKLVTNTGFTVGEAKNVTPENAMMTNSLMDLELLVRCNSCKGRAKDFTFHLRPKSVSVCEDKEGDFLRGLHLNLGGLEYEKVIEVLRDPLINKYDVLFINDLYAQTYQALFGIENKRDKVAKYLSENGFYTRHYTSGCSLFNAGLMIASRHKIEPYEGDFEKVDDEFFTSHGLVFCTVEAPLKRYGTNVFKKVDIIVTDVKSGLDDSDIRNRQHSFQKMADFFNEKSYGQDGCAMFCGGFSVNALNTGSQEFVNLKSQITGLEMAALTSQEVISTNNNPTRNSKADKEMGDSLLDYYFVTGGNAFTFVERAMVDRETLKPLLKRNPVGCFFEL